MTAYECLSSGVLAPKDYNCAEQIIHAANIAYAMGLTDQECKLAAGFGGGMGVFSTCGTITAGCMVLSHLFVKERGHESDYIKKLTGELIAQVKEKLSTDNCEKLREMYRTPEDGCKYVILEAAKILDTIVLRERAA